MDFLFILRRPKEGSHGELPLIVDVSGDRQTILTEKTVEFPLRHSLVVGFPVPWIVKRHLEVTGLVAASAPAAQLMPIWL